ncbi:MAG: OadG family transporter subunit [Lachnospiraceae bacterium]
MKKKISLLLCLLVTVLCFTACGNKSAENQYDEAELEQVTEFLIGYCAGADEEAFEQWYGMSDFAIDLQLTEAQIPFDADCFLGVLSSWQAGVEECGNYIEHGEYTYKVSNGDIEVSTEAIFEERNATISFMFDEDSKLESMTINAEMGTGEILKKAGLNTLLGMGTVFIVLIIIAFIISLFKYIPAIQEAFSKNNKKAEPEKAEPAKMKQNSLAAASPSEKTDDGELIAVIAAAIAAARADAKAEGTSTDGFVVRSIRRRPSNKWNSK